MIIQTTPKTGLLNNPKNGMIPITVMIPENGALNMPKNGMLNDPKNGVQNLSENPSNESLSRA